MTTTSPAKPSRGCDRSSEETGIKGSIELYPEAEHGFAFPTRRLYHKASSERHWERLFAMFRRALWAVILLKPIETLGKSCCIV